jgi:cytochrome c oxidase subunit 3
MYLQTLAGYDLVDIGVYLKTNPSASFLYVIAGLHIFHIITGLVFLFVLAYQVFSYKVHSRNMLVIDMASTYWHFLDALWLYLLFFFIANH